MDLKDITVLNDLAERLQKITPAQIEATGRKLKDKSPMAPRGKKKGEKVIGVVVAETTRALYTLVMALAAEEMLTEAQKLSAIDEIAERDHQEKAALLDMLGDVARELFWAQAKVDLGFHEKASIGLREGWTLVRDNSRGDSGPAFLAGLNLLTPTEEE
jgi:hypothetical protein